MARQKKKNALLKGVAAAIGALAVGLLPQCDNPRDLVKHSVDFIDALHEELHDEEPDRDCIKKPKDISLAPLPAS